MARHIRYLKQNRHGGFEYLRKIPRDLLALLRPHEKNHGLCKARYFGTDRAAAEVAVATQAARDTALWAELRKLSPVDRLNLTLRGGFEVVRAAIGPLQEWQQALSAELEGIQAKLEDVAAGPQELGQAVLELRQKARTAALIPGTLREHAASTGVALAAIEGSLSWWLARWCTSARAENKTPQHIAAVTTNVQRLVGLVGDKQVRAITQGDVRALADLLARTPSQNRIPKAHRQRPWHELAALGLPPQKISTAKHSLGQIAGFFSFIVQEQGLSASPALGATVARPSGGFSEAQADRRRPFSGVQVRAILDHFGASRSPKALEQHWIVHLCAYQGLRIEEAIQLRAGDVRLIERIPALDINDRHGRHLKNATAAAALPLHPAIAKDLQAFVAEAQQRGGEDGPLFQNTASKGRRQSKKFARQFGTVLRRDLRIADPRLTLHSLRHTFTTCAARVGLPLRVELDLCRHAVKGGGGAHETYIHGQRMRTLLRGLSRIDPLSL